MDDTGAQGQSEQGQPEHTQTGQGSAQQQPGWAVGAPRIEERDEFTVVGLAVDCPNWNTEPIGELWQEFVKRAEGLKEHIAGEPVGLWGVSLPLADGSEGFRYLACAIVKADAPVPDGMAKETIPANKYMLRDYCGPMPELGPAYQHMYHTDLPAAGMASSDPFVGLEFYAPDWMDSGDGKAKLTLYVGVKDA